MRHAVTEWSSGINLKKTASIPSFDNLVATRAPNLTNRSTATLFNRSLSNIKSQINSMQHTLQSLQNEFDENRSMPKSPLHRDQLFRNKIQKRLQDKTERISIPSAYQRPPTPTQSTLIKHHTTHTAGSQSPKQTFQQTSFFDKIKQQLRQVSLMTPTGDEIRRKQQVSPINDDCTPLSQRKFMAMNHYQNNPQQKSHSYHTSLHDSKRNIKTSQSLRNIQDQISTLQNTLRSSSNTKMVGQKIADKPLSKDRESIDSKDIKKSKDSSFMDLLQNQLANFTQQQKVVQRVKKINNITIRTADVGNDDIFTKVSSPKGDLMKENRGQQSLQTLKNSLAALQNTLKQNNLKSRPETEADEKNESFLDLIKNQLKRVSRLQRSQNSSSDSEEVKRDNTKEQIQRLTSSLKKKNRQNSKKNQRVRFKPQISTGNDSESFVNSKKFQF